MSLTLFAQNIVVLVTLIFLMLARYTRNKYQSLESRASKDSKVYVNQYLFYYLASILLSSLSCITVIVLAIVNIYQALN